MRTRGRRIAAAVLDAVTYALTATALVTIAVALVSLPLGYGLVGVKFGLFYLGFLVWAIAIVVAWPGSAWKSPNLSFDFIFGGSERDDETVVPWVDTEPADASGEPEQTPFQAFVQRLPPARFLPARPGSRLPTGLRLFLAAFAIHGTSFLLEVALGVRA